MEINYQIDDASLLKKRCISESDVLALLPQELRAEVHKIRLLHSLSCPLVWVIFLKKKHSGAGRCYEYVPFSGEVECNLAGPSWQYRKSVRTAFFYDSFGKGGIVIMAAKRGFFVRKAVYAL